jgi:hypothetical protein
VRVRRDHQVAADVGYRLRIMKLLAPR